MTAILARRDDTADALADWHRTPRWRLLRRRALWRRVEALTDDLMRLVARQATQP